MVSKIIARGERNNNPLNLRYLPSVKWQGLDNPATDGDFCRFINPVFGIRAGARQLIKYQDDYGCRNIKDFFKRWAPANENNTEKYIERVLNGIFDSGLAVSESQPYDLHNYDCLRPMIEAMIRVELGYQPYTRAQIDKALLMAGVEPPHKAVGKTVEVKAAQVAAGGTVLGALAPAAGQLAQQIEPASGLLQTMAMYAPWALAIVVLAAIGWIIYAKWDQNRKGL